MGTEEVRMKARLPVIAMAGLFAFACAPDTDEQATMDTAPAETPAPTADEMAVEQLAADYETHYNMHHASVVADMFTDSAVVLLANGSHGMNKAEILAGLEADMAASPTLTIDPAASLVFGDVAVSRGSYRASATPPGASELSTSGHYIGINQREDGAWKIQLLVTNFDAEPPEGAMAAPPAEPGEPPAEDGTMKELGAQFTQAFNAGDWATVAAMYAEDAVVAFANGPLVEGRAGVQQRFAEMWTGTQSVVIHDVGTLELGNDMVADGGWFEITATTADGDVSSMGAYLNLLRRQPDGSYQIVWGITNGQPAPAN
jgi:uncharacterized protein (TIGR02246 family)